METTNQERKTELKVIQTEGKEYTVKLKQSNLHLTRTVMTKRVKFYH